ncbi:hypothetical protein FB382_002724 [Nocardioides ginsengisegetis]|uniref:Uncharacterized protein n=1 Tax=Nocardioides ginsengisegetis TaxID=661491 RepID=A0A7W3PAB5_9ACTN|nr:hypothetical protein [Nocardioides ginsengisegetis]MBA8804433.1 hypothetical protein [Nocardioides ginsengisegetis]
MRLVRIGAPLGAAALLVAVGLHGLGGSSAAPASMGTPSVVEKPRLVMVSGRDDHGMVAEEKVPLYDGPDAAHQVDAVYDGTLAEVLSIDGQMLQVRTVEGRPAIGWVDDFFLRGEVRLVGKAPSCASSIDGRSREGGTIVVVRQLRQGRVFVESVTPPVTSGWASRDDVQELPPQGPQCGDIPLDDKHAHHH